MNVIAWTYDADVHCTDCANVYAFNRHGVEDPHGCTDSEGNEMHPTMAYETVGNLDDHDFEDGPYVVGCSTCGFIIEAQENASSSLEMYPFRTVEQFQRDWNQHRYETVRDELEDAAMELREARDTIERSIAIVADIGRGIATVGDLAAHLHSAVYV